MYQPSAQFADLHAPLVPILRYVLATAPLPRAGIALDLACGAGLKAPLLAEACGPGVRLVGLDRDAGARVRPRGRDAPAGRAAGPARGEPAPAARRTAGTGRACPILRDRSGGRRRAVRDRAGRAGTGLGCGEAPFHPAPIGPS